MAWSDAARAAALEARKRRRGAAQYGVTRSLGTGWLKADYYTLFSAARSHSTADKQKDRDADAAAVAKALLRLQKRTKR